MRIKITLTHTIYINMINGKYISLGEVLWRLMKNPLMEDLDYEEAASHTLSVLKLINAPLLFEDRVEKIKIEYHKGYIPDNVLNVHGVRAGGVPLRYATDIYHSADKSCKDCPSEFTYTLQNCVIKTSFSDGEVEVAFKAIVVDEHGYPMIPDNESVVKAIEYHIQSMYLESYWMMGKIPDKVFQYVQQQRDWYVAQAQNAGVLQGPDQLESIMNSINRLIINDNAFTNFYRGFGEKERIKPSHI